MSNTNANANATGKRSALAELRAILAQTADDDDLVPLREVLAPPILMGQIKPKGYDYDRGWHYAKTVNAKLIQRGKERLKCGGKWGRGSR